MEDSRHLVDQRRSCLCTAQLAGLAEGSQHSAGRQLRSSAGSQLQAGRPAGLGRPDRLVELTCLSVTEQIRYTVGVEH